MAKTKRHASRTNQELGASSWSGSSPCLVAPRSTIGRGSQLSGSHGRAALRSPETHCATKWHNQPGRHALPRATRLLASKAISESAAPNELTAASKAPANVLSPPIREGVSPISSPNLCDVKVAQKVAKMHLKRQWRLSPIQRCLNRGTRNYESYVASKTGYHWYCLTTLRLRRFFFQTHVPHCAQLTCATCAHPSRATSATHMHDRQGMNGTCPTIWHMPSKRMQCMKGVLCTRLATTTEVTHVFAVRSDLLPPPRLSSLPSPRHLPARTTLCRPG